MHMIVQEDMPSKTPNKTSKQFMIVFICHFVSHHCCATLNVLVGYMGPLHLVEFDVKPCAMGAYIKFGL